MSVWGLGAKCACVWLEGVGGHTTPSSRGIYNVIAHCLCGIKRERERNRDMEDQIEKKRGREEDR